MNSQCLPVRSFSKQTPEKNNEGFPSEKKNANKKCAAYSISLFRSRM